MYIFQKPKAHSHEPKAEGGMLKAHVPCRCKAYTLSFALVLINSQTRKYV